jgi:hypothetical protein
MLTTRITFRAGTPFFELCSNGTTISKFYYPLMDTAELRKMIAGQEAQDQNDDGFRISTKGRVVTIEIMMAIDGGDCEYVEFNLPLEVCKPAFDQLLPLHEDNPDSNLDFDEDEIRDQTMAAGPCNCGRDGCDDCRALKEGRDVGVKLINDEILKEITEISRRDLERAQAAVNTAITNLESFDVTADVEASSDEEDQRSNLPTEEEMDFRSRHQSMSYRSW